MYYGFTTLSTVGFGDLTPLNSAERLVCAFIMLFGVAVTSLILSRFLDIINVFKSFDQDLSEEQQDQLECFFDCLKIRFNREQEFNSGIRSRIETFMDHRWKNDKN